MSGFRPVIGAAFNPLHNTAAFSADALVGPFASAAFALPGRLFHFIFRFTWRLEMLLLCPREIASGENGRPAAKFRSTEAGPVVLTGSSATVCLGDV